MLETFGNVVYYIIYRKNAAPAAEYKIGEMYVQKEI